MFKHRYRPVEGHTEESTDVELKLSHLFNKNKLKSLFVPKYKHPTQATSKLVNWLTFECIFCIVVICLILSKIKLTHWYIIVIMSSLSFKLLMSMVIIWCQPQVSNINTFKIPLVPFIPLLSVFLNVYMITTLGPATWVRFIVWFIIGNILKNASFFSQNCRGCS